MQQVPQFIDTADKVAGPFTWQQLVWFVSGGGLLVFLWQILDKPAFYTSAVPVVLITVLFAFYRPQNMPFLSYVRYALIYFFKPRLFLWQREVREEKEESSEAREVRESQEMPVAKREVTAQDIASLTQALDSHGGQTNARLQEIIEQNAKPQKSHTSLFGKLKKKSAKRKSEER